MLINENFDDDNQDGWKKITTNNIKVIGTIDLEENGWLTLQVKYWPEIKEYMVYLKSDDETVCIAEFRHRMVGAADPMHIAAKLARRKLLKVCDILEKVGE